MKDEESSYNKALEALLQKVVVIIKSQVILCIFREVQLNGHQGGIHIFR